jgi:uncharacterized membrane protein
MIHGPSEERVQQVIGMLLRLGVMIAAGVVAAGGMCYLVESGAARPEYHEFHGLAEDLRTVPGVWQGVLDFRCASIIQLGILMLIATPIARVAFSAAAFGLQRDWTYTAITSIVLAILLYGLVWGG